MLYARQNGGCKAFIHLIHEYSAKIIKTITILLSQVTTLKERIEQEKGKDGFPVAGLKLIYAGMFTGFLQVYCFIPT